MKGAAARRPAGSRAAGQRDRAPRLVVHVTDARGRRAPRGRGLGAWLARAAPRHARGVVSIALVSDSTMRRLNREYRGIDRATDVLSFADTPAAKGPPSAVGRRPSAGPGGRGSGAAAPLGDLAIATGVARRQARDCGHSLALELRILALHGLLHLLGYDHQADQGEMGMLEDRLRRRAGLPSALIARAAASATRR
jgi:probable rRNA maturation factor